jgi:hypothetical protein
MAGNVGDKVTSAWWGGSQKTITESYGAFENVTVNGVNYSGPHTGIDVGMPVGTPLTTPVHAVVDGVGTDNVGNKFVRLLLDNGDKVLLLHLNDQAVSKGQDLSPGALLGHSGNSGLSTGPHLHFEVDHMGVPTNPFDTLTHFLAQATPMTTTGGGNWWDGIAQTGAFFSHLSNPGHDPCSPPSDELGMFRLIDGVTCPKNWWRAGFVSLGVVLIGVGVFIYFFKEERAVYDQGSSEVKQAAMVAA